MELESAQASETNTKAKDNLAQAIRPQQAIKFLGFYVYGRQTLFKNESDEFMEF